MLRDTPYMVFYLLTPAGLGGYSYINLFPPSPATDGVLRSFAAKASDWLTGSIPHPVATMRDKSGAPDRVEGNSKE